MIEEKDVMVPTRGGARIALRIYRPRGAGRAPALYASSSYRYDNNDAPDTALFPWRETGPIQWYVEQQGYAALARLDLARSLRRRQRAAAQGLEDAEPDADANDAEGLRPKEV